MNRHVSTFGFYYPVQWLRRERIHAAVSALAEYRELDARGRGLFRDRALSDLLTHLWQSPFYERVLREAGIPPNTPLRSETLLRLPVLTKRHLRDDESDIAVDGHRVSWRKTSGSTGMPLRFRKDRLATAMMDALMYDRYSWYGVRPGDPQARIWGRALGGRQRLVQQLVDLGMNRRRLSTFDISTEAVDAYVRQLSGFQPRMVYAYPNALASAIQLASRPALETLRALPIKAVVVTGEMLLPWQRDLFGGTFDAPIVNEYGSTENGIIGFDCPSGQMHVSSELLHLEVLGSSGEPTELGEGRLLVTELFSRSVPFVRYELGDKICLEASSCPCGRDGPLIQSLEGRVDSFILLPDGRQVYDAVLAYALGGKVHAFRAQQTALDHLRIEVVPRESDLSPSVTHTVLRELRAHLGETLEIELVPVTKIEPEPSGKLRYFIPLRKDAQASTTSSEMTNS